MTKMTKMFFALLIMVMANQANAQLKFGVKAGLNLTNYGYNYAVPADEPNSNLNIGYHIGGIVNYTISDAFGVEAGLILSTRGASSDLNAGLDAGETVSGFDRTSATYLVIPINVTYTISKFEISTGPYIGIGLFGKNKYDYTVTEGADSFTNKGENAINFGNKIEFSELLSNENMLPMSALDLGWNIGVGYMISDMLRVNAAYSFGFSNLVPEVTGFPSGVQFNSSDFAYKNRAFTVGVSYFFGG